MRKRGAEPPIIAAKRRKNAAHGASRGSQVGNEQAPEGRKNGYDTDSGGTTQVLTHPLHPAETSTNFDGLSRRGPLRTSSFPLSS